MPGKTVFILRRAPGIQVRRHQLGGCCRRHPVSHPQGACPAGSAARPLLPSPSRKRVSIRTPLRWDSVAAPHSQAEAKSIPHGIWDMRYLTDKAVVVWCTDLWRIAASRSVKQTTAAGTTHNRLFNWNQCCNWVLWLWWKIKFTVQLWLYYAFLKGQHARVMQQNYLYVVEPGILKP